MISLLIVMLIDIVVGSFFASDGDIKMLLNQSWENGISLIQLSSLKWSNLSIVFFILCHRGHMTAT